LEALKMESKATGNSRESGIPKISGGNSGEFLNSLREFPGISKIQFYLIDCHENSFSLIFEFKSVAGPP